MPEILQESNEWQPRMKTIQRILTTLKTRSVIWSCLFGYIDDDGNVVDDDDDDDDGSDDDDDADDDVF